MNSADLDTNDLETNINTSSDYKLANIIGSLQNLFAIMEFSPRRAVDPHDFITKLGLDPQVQQDAQEFSKLFLSLLEGDNVASNEKLKNNDPKIILPSMVKDQFRGNYERVHAQRVGSYSILSKALGRILKWVAGAKNFGE